MRWSSSGYQVEKSEALSVGHPHFTADGAASKEKKSMLTSLWGVRGHLRRQQTLGGWLELQIGRAAAHS